MKDLFSRSIVVLIVACGSSLPPSLHATNYDRNCVVDSDCVAIADTSQCECPVCSTSAINVADQTAYAADLKAYEDACKGTPCSNIACPNVTPYCDNGTCQVK
jgi:hypothetical protein